MNEDIERSLLQNFMDFVESADRDLANKKYNPAVSNYFKSIVILCDWKIYKEIRLLPKNHAERFQFLEIHLKEAYSIISPLFKKYTDSYNIRLTEKDAVLLKENVKKIKELFDY